MSMGGEIDPGIDAARDRVVRLATSFTRNILDQKSANKVRMEPLVHDDGTTKPATIDRTIRNAGLLRDLRRSTEGSDFLNKLNGGAATIQDISDYARRILAIGTGNCLEYAVVAFDILYSGNCRPIEFVQLAYPSTHCFVVLGLARPRGNVGQSLAWGEGVYVCDPWANIATKVGQYQAEWTSKMAKWGRAGKTIVLGNNDGYISPENYTLPNHNKLVLFSVA
jgi:hypothetical protein